GRFQVAFTEDLRDAVWPYLAENLDVFDAALGVSTESVEKLDRATTIGILKLLPATPARFFAPLLDVATGVTQAGRADARALLGEQPEVGGRLISLLGDSHQTIHTNTTK